MTTCIHRKYGYRKNSILSMTKLLSVVLLLSSILVVIGVHFRLPDEVDQQQDKDQLQETNKDNNVNDNVVANFPSRELQSVFQVDAFECDQNLNPVIQEQEGEGDGENGDIVATEPEPKQAGDTIRICVRPSRYTSERGIYIRSINSFVFTKDDTENGKGMVEEYAIQEGGKESPNTLLTCRPGSTMCVFRYKLPQSLFKSDGNVTGVGDIYLEYGLDVEDNSMTIDNTNDRKLRGTQISRNQPQKHLLPLSDKQRRIKLDLQSAGNSEAVILIRVVKSLDPYVRRSPTDVWSDLGTRSQYGVLGLVIFIISLVVCCILGCCYCLYMKDKKAIVLLDGKYPRDIDVDSQASFFKTFFKRDEDEDYPEESDEDSESEPENLYVEEDYVVPLGVPLEVFKEPDDLDYDNNANGNYNPPPQEQAPPVRSIENNRRRSSVASGTSQSSSASQEAKSFAESTVGTSVQESKNGVKSKASTAESTKNAKSANSSAKPIPKKKKDTTNKKKSNKDGNKNQSGNDSKRDSLHSASNSNPSISNSAPAASKSTNKSNKDDQQNSTPKMIRPQKQKQPIKKVQPPPKQDDSTCSQGETSKTSVHVGSSDSVSTLSQSCLDDGIFSTYSKKKVPKSEKSLPFYAAAKVDVEEWPSDDELSTDKMQPTITRKDNPPTPPPRQKTKTFRKIKFVPRAPESSPRKDTGNDNPTLDDDSDDDDSTKEKPAKGKTDDDVQSNEGYTTNGDTDNSDDKDSVNFQPDDRDVAFDNLNHPGTMVYKMAIGVAVKTNNAGPFSQKVVRIMKKQLAGRRYYIQDKAGKLGFWRVATKDEIETHIRNSYEEATKTKA